MIEAMPKAKPPATADELRAAILERYDTLSKRLQQIARYVLDEPNGVALETLAVIAERCDVQPSAIVRFAQGFGYVGASQMQRLFRDGLLSGNAALGQGDRVRQFNAAASDTSEGGANVLAEFVEGDMLALRNLSQTVSEDDMARAATLIDMAETVYVVGFRRSFPVASYLTHALQLAGKRAHFGSGLAGLSRQEIQMMTPKDLLIAISDHPYARETIEAVGAAAEKGARVLSISDSLVSPIAKRGDVVLLVRESEVRSFRSLAASMCLAQALAIGFARETKIHT